MEEVPYVLEQRWKKYCACLYNGGTSTILVRTAMEQVPCLLVQRWNKYHASTNKDPIMTRLLQKHIFVNRAKVRTTAKFWFYICRFHWRIRSQNSHQSHFTRRDLKKSHCFKYPDLRFFSNVLKKYYLPILVFCHKHQAIAYKLFSQVVCWNTVLQNTYNGIVLLSKVACLRLYRREFPGKLTKCSRAALPSNTFLQTLYCVHQRFSSSWG